MFIESTEEQAVLPELHDLVTPCKSKIIAYMRHFVVDRIVCS